MHANQTLLNSIDGPAAVTINANGDSEIVLVCEHASNRIPHALNNLGLEPETIESHAAWDPGAAAVALLLSQSLDAPLVNARFSRLVYDLNRPPEHPDAMRSVSEVHHVPGNEHLSPEDERERVNAIYKPFCAQVALVLDKTISRHSNPVLVTIHTFNPVYHGQKREVELGILHDDDTRLADQMLQEAAHLTTMVTRRNEPYGPEDGVAHTMRLHAIPNGILNVMLEIRNDLVATPEQQTRVAEEIDTILRAALSMLNAPTKILPLSKGVQA
ncbi:MAG: N-formylglutamate amidohydrolase [Hyphomicrobiales bacterium]